MSVAMAEFGYFDYLCSFYFLESTKQLNRFEIGNFSLVSCFGLEDRSLKCFELRCFYFL